MSLRGSLVTPHKLPSSSPGSAVSRMTNGTEKSWSPQQRFLEKDKTVLSQRSRPLTVYDVVPPSLGGKDYQKWTEEWLPRLSDSWSIPGQKTLNPVKRDPIGFAISPRRTTASVDRKIGPTVLHFNNGRTKDKPERNPVNNKPRTRVYTKSAFRRPEEEPNRASLFHVTRPLSTRKSMSQRPITPGSAVALPDKYQLPVEGEGHEQILPEARLENYLEPDKRKYMVLSRSLNSAAQSPGTGKENDGIHREFEDQLEQFGVRADPYNLISVSISRKGTLHHGNSWKRMDTRADCDDGGPSFTVNNSGRSRSLTNTIKVKDVLGSTGTVEHTYSHEEN